MNDYYTAKEISEMLEVGRSTAYKMIKRLNLELQEKGYITISGRVSRKYFEERTYTK